MKLEIAQLKEALLTAQAAAAKLNCGRRKDFGNPAMVGSLLRREVMVNDALGAQAWEWLRESINTISKWSLRR